MCGTLTWTRSHRCQREFVGKTCFVAWKKLADCEWEEKQLLMAPPIYFSCHGVPTCRSCATWASFASKRSLWCSTASQQVHATKFSACTFLKCSLSTRVLQSLSCTGSPCRRMHHTVTSGIQGTWGVLCMGGPAEKQCVACVVCFCGDCRRVRGRLAVDAREEGWNHTRAISGRAGRNHQFEVTAKHVRTWCPDTKRRVHKSTLSCSHMGGVFHLHPPSHSWFTRCCKELQVWCHRATVNRSVWFSSSLST